MPRSQGPLRRAPPRLHQLRQAAHPMHHRRSTQTAHKLRHTLQSIRLELIIHIGPGSSATGAPPGLDSGHPVGAQRCPGSSLAPGRAARLPRFVPVGRPHLDEKRTRKHLGQHHLGLPRTGPLQVRRILQPPGVFQLDRPSPRSSAHHHLRPQSQARSLGLHI